LINYWSPGFSSSGFSSHPAAVEFSFLSCRDSLTKENQKSAFQRFPSRDLGLLILRAAGFLLAAAFVLQKIGWYWTAFHAGKSLSAIGLAPLIARMGFPIPVRAWKENSLAMCFCGEITFLADGRI